MDVVTTRFGQATSLKEGGGGVTLTTGGGGGVTLTTGEEVGDLKARIEEMKRSMAKDSTSAGRDDDDDDFGWGLAILMTWRKPSHGDFFSMVLQCCLYLCKALTENMGLNGLLRK